MTPNGRRLTEYLRACVQRARRRTWIYVDTQRLCECLGWSVRTFRRAMAEARRSDARIRFMTVFQSHHGRKGAWRVVATLPERKWAESMIFSRDCRGRRRHVRTWLRGAVLVIADVGSECHPLEERASPDMATTPLPRAGRSGRPPPAMVRMAWGVARDLATWIEQRKPRIRGELRLPQCARALADALRDGLCASSLLKSLRSELESAHVHNTDERFDRSGRMRTRSWGFVISRGIRRATKWCRPNAKTADEYLDLSNQPGHELGCFAKIFHCPAVSALLAESLASV